MASYTTRRRIEHLKDGRVYYDGVLQYDPNAEDDQNLYTEEEIFTTRLYSSALEELVGEDLKYSSNYNMYNRWEPDMQLWWIKQVEAQAQAGKQTIGVDVVTRAAIIRLTRS